VKLVVGGDIAGEARQPQVGAGGYRAGRVRRSGQGDRAAGGGHVPPQRPPVRTDPGDGRRAHGEAGDPEETPPVEHWRIATTGRAERWTLDALRSMVPAGYARFAMLLGTAPAGYARLIAALGPAPAGYARLIVALGPAPAGYARLAGSGPGGRDHPGAEAGVGERRGRGSRQRRQQRARVRVRAAHRGRHPDGGEDCQPGEP